MTHHFWGDLTTRDFEGLDPERAVAVLPVAAIEQHGPHLPVSTDTAIAQGMIGEVVRLAPRDVALLVLPVQAIGKSNEHLRCPGTLTLSAETAIRAWVDIGQSVARAGVRKLIIVNSHGGNAELIGIVARELRVSASMLAVTCAWMRFGTPPGLYTEEELQTGIHGGDVETSLMLHFRPELVRMEAAKAFSPTSIDMPRQFDLLRTTGPVAFGWIAQDIHAEGVAGDASRASAEKGRATARYQAEAFVRLLLDVRRFSLDRLA